ncbi:MAG: glutamate 5-kinase, partial [Pseudomonadota bacterium]
MSQTKPEGRAALAKARRVVVKIGSSLLTDDGRGLNRQALDGWVDELSALVGRGLKLLLVTSGAVASGMQRLGVKQRPHALHELQAMAAVGQMGLVQAYESSFQRHGLHTAQVLLTHEDFVDRERYLNVR